MMGKRILVIEDQEDNRRILRDLLTSVDFEVIEAVDGEGGLAAAAAHRPDLILMDIQLPGLDGYEATRRTRLVLSLIQLISCDGNDGYSVQRRVGFEATGCFITVEPRQLDIH